MIVRVQQGWVQSQDPKLWCLVENPFLLLPTSPFLDRHIYGRAWEP
jgi:hypothetical protein